MVSPLSSQRLHQRLAAESSVTLLGNSDCLLLLVALHKTICENEAMLFEDALTLADGILTLAFLQSVKIGRDTLSLPRLEAEVSMEAWPEPTEEEPHGHRVTVLLRRGPYKRWLVVRPGSTPWPVQHKRTWRLAERRALQRAKVEETSPVTVLAKAAEIYVDRRTTREDIAIQICAYAIQWWRLEPTDTDWEKICRHLGNDKQLAGDVLLRFTSPEHPASFRSFVSRTKQITRAKEASVGVNLDLSNSDERGGDLQPSECDEEMEQTKSERFQDELAHQEKKRRKRPGLVIAPESLSVSRLASLSRERKEKIYLAIRNGKLGAKKGRWGIRVPTDEANRFVWEAHEEQREQDLRRLLKNLGKSKTASRWRILRWRKTGLNQQEINSKLEEWAKQEATKLKRKRQFL